MAGREPDRTPEKAMEGLLRHTLRQGQQGDPLPDPCPGGEILAAYFERSLDDGETAECELHLSRCGRCREQQAAMGRADTLPPNTESDKPRWAWLWDWRWLAPATAVLIIAAVWYARHPEMTAEKHPQLAYVARSESAEPPAGAIAPPVPENKVAPAPVTPPNGLSNGAPEKAEHQESGSRPAEVQARRDKENRADRKAADEFASNVETDALNKDSAALSRDANAPGAAGEVPPAAPVPAESSDTAAQKTPASPAAGAVGGAIVGVGGVAGAAAANEPPLAAAKTKQLAPLALSGRDTGLSAALQRPAATLVRTPNPQVLWRIGTAGLVERSMDGGATWMGKIPSAGAQLTAGSAPAENICWLVGRGGLILLTTNAVDWKTISPPAKADFVDIVAKDALEATVTAANGRRFTTKDGGTTWQTEP